MAVMPALVAGQVLGFNDGPHLLQCMLQIVFSGVADVQMGLGQPRHHVRGYAPFECDIQMQSGLGLGQRMQRKHLVRQGGNRAGALLRIDPGMGGHTLDFKVDAVEPCAVDEIATMRPGSASSTALVHPGEISADAPAGRRESPLLHRRKRTAARERRCPQARQGLQQKHVHHQAGLHVGHAWAVGPAGFDTGTGAAPPCHVGRPCPCGPSTADGLWLRGRGRRHGPAGIRPSRAPAGFWTGNAGGLQACAQQCDHSLYAFNIAAAAVGSTTCCSSSAWRWPVRPAIAARPLRRRGRGGRGRG